MDIKHKGGIDFIINIYDKRFYLKVVVDSIHKYVKGIDYKINIVNCWHGDEAPGLAELDEMFGDDEKVNIIQGFDQSKTTIVQSDGSVSQNPKHSVRGDIDGNSMAPGSLYTMPGIRKAMDATDNKYICILDADVIFLNEWVDKIIPLTEDNFFMANRWDPGTLFKKCKNPIAEKGIGKFMFFLMKRANIVDNDIYPSRHYRDVGGNITLYAQDNNLPFKILKNTYWNNTRRGYYGIDYFLIQKWHVGGANSQEHINTEHHLIDLVYGEQMYVDGTPFAFHQNRFIRNTTPKNDDWMIKATKYLEEN